MRDLYLIFGMAGVAIVIGVGLFFIGPASLQSDVSNALTPGASDTSADVPFTVLAQGPVAYSVNSRTNYRITNQVDFSTLWTLIYGAVDAPQIPHINFDKEEILASFDGTHASNGYIILIQAVQDKDSVRTLYITHEIPGSTCRTQTQYTSPFELVEVPRTTFELAHQDLTSTSTCL